MHQFVKIVPGDGLKESLLARCLYYTQRLVTAPYLRHYVAGLVARCIRARHDSMQPDAPSLDSARLHSHGYAHLGALLSDTQCTDIHAFLRDRSLSERYEQNGRFTLASKPEGIRLAEYDLVDIINCPHILALANSDRLIGLAEQYLHCKPTLSSLVLRWSFPTDVPAGNVQRFHRDSDDWRYLKIMVYLTDVTASDGPHVYVLGTHKEAASFRIKVEDDVAVHQRYGTEAAQVVTGPQGSGFAVDTAGIHKGQMPLIKPRLMLQIQYSLLPNFANRYVPQPYAGMRTFDPYVNRLLVATSQTKPLAQAW